MTAESKPLQGDFFINPEEEGVTKTSRKTPVEDKDYDIKDEDLTKDAELRPRKKNGSNTKNKLVFKEPNSVKPSNLPNWSHHSLVELEELTPALKHYVELKIKNPKRILLYRLGDFFECFFEDAIQLSQLLELTLTGKDGGKNIGRVPMAGIPHHAAEKYCSILIQKGLSIAICDQLESVHNKEGKLIKRGITRILTPGTVIESGMLQAKKNNWLASILIESKANNDSLKWGLASADISTGEFKAEEGEGINSLEQNLLTIEASEIVSEKLDPDILKNLKLKHIQVHQLSKTSFSLPEAESIIKKHYQLKAIQGIGFKESQLALRAAGGLIGYLYETNPIQKTTFKSKNNQAPLEVPKINFPKNSLFIDAQTRRNLEITKTQRDGKFQGSFLWAIDRTLTAMGGRCIRQWVDNPLIDVNKILQRQNLITVLVSNRALRITIRGLLKSMGDLERLAGRAGAGQAGARELIAIAEGLERLPQLSSYLNELPKNLPPWFTKLQKINPELIDLAKRIKDELIDNPPLNITEGGIIYDGVDPILDGLRNQLDDQDKWLANQEKKERRISRINNLKLQYHRTFGYFLSVSKSKAHDVPSHWIRRQTLANEERFVTPDLKAKEGKIFQLKIKSCTREYELFCKLRELVGIHAPAIRQSAKAIAGLDVLAGLAELAATNNYCPPTIIGIKDDSDSRKINIKECRHPVVEQLLVEELFQPNSINLGNKTDLIILTGPNASGKSCFLRQIGLIQLLTQIGSWIPAKKANISIADKIFTRVGAVDDLAAGQSTFMVEMAETAFILNQATKNSLVLLDEIGRGTSTFDGLSIAWSVSEFLARSIRSRTIFATHYQELNALSESLNNISNFQVLVKEAGESISFLHKVIPGASNRSYGIEVARLAGVPIPVIQRARKVLNELEKKNKN
ncbi:DNA mismatch repair protein MutS [Prochlorococcus marinus]|uniref:DNA mismatch repair protein MutS n=1 Tax=Prochlorococcus marinus TaxID=1219 RepID=UPI0022B38D57|nr:DNA mismatch repair protein MutS [Prochlorococcus marinus]